MLGREVAHVEAADFERPGLVPADSARPERGQQLVVVLGRPEPGWNNRDVAITGRVQGPSLVNGH